MSLFEAFASQAAVAIANARMHARIVLQRTVEKELFPQKVWSECVRCPFFTDCREIAVVRARIR